MKLKTIGTGSSGNCYVLDTGESYFIIEAGIRPDKVLPAIDFAPNKVDGIAVSHVHGDHAKYADKLHERLFGKTSGGAPVLTLRNYSRFKVNRFVLSHDVTTHGFILDHARYGRIVYASDTNYMTYKISGISCLMIECNYSEAVLTDNVRDGKINEHLAQRIRESHMALETVKQYLGLIDTSKLKSVVLMHLSDNNSDAERFKEEIQKVAAVPVYVAEPGKEVYV